MPLLSRFRAGRSIRAKAKALDSNAWAARSGWKSSGKDTSVGWFRLGASSPIRGRIESPGGRPKVYMHRPPAAVKAHICVHETKGGWFFLHPHETPEVEPLRVTVNAVQGWLQSLLCEVKR